MKVEDLKKETTKKVEVKRSVEGDNYWSIKNLPSKFKLYPTGTEIKGRPLKVLDVKYLATLDEDNFNDIVNDILRRCITGIDINDLLVPDKLYIIFWLRANTYKDSGYEVEFDCPKCSKPSTYNFSLDSLNVLYIKKDYNDKKIVELPSSKDKLQIRYQTVRDELSIEEFLNKNETNITPYNKDILKVASIIDSINEKDSDNLKRLYEYLTIDLNPSDYSYLEAYVTHMDIGISPVVNVKCNKCGGPTLTGVTFSGDFFIPKYKFE